MRAGGAAAGSGATAAAGDVSGISWLSQAVIADEPVLHPPRDMMTASSPAILTMAWRSLTSLFMAPDLEMFLIEAIRFRTAQRNLHEGGTSSDAGTSWRTPNEVIAVMAVKS